MAICLTTPNSHWKLARKYICRRLSCGSLVSSATDIPSPGGELLCTICVCTWKVGVWVSKFVCLPSPPRCVSTHTQLVLTTPSSYCKLARKHVKWFISLLCHWRHSTSCVCVWRHVLVERASTQTWTLILQLSMYKHRWCTTVLHQVRVWKCAWC